MYEDGWLSLMPEQQHQHSRSVSTSSQSRGHRRKESLLQQPNVRGLEAMILLPLQSLTYMCRELRTQLMSPSPSKTCTKKSN